MLRSTHNAVEANEPSYEEMRVNQDQSLHLWELEYSVFNGSGRALDHLIAHYDIDSPWPPCTNWTENYRLGAEHDFIQVQWEGPSGRIQHTGSATPTLPNPTNAETKLLLAFNGVRPEFTDWSVNYTFMEGEVPAAAAPAVAPATPQQAASDPAAPCEGDQVELELTCTETSFDESGFGTEIPFVNGVVHGMVIDRNPYYASETPYVNGVRQGTSIDRRADGNVVETPYVNGEMHGIQITRWGNGNVQERPHVNGIVHGTWIDRYNNGLVCETIWVNGEIAESLGCVAGSD